MTAKDIHERDMLILANNSREQTLVKMHVVPEWTIERKKNLTLRKKLRDEAKLGISGEGNA